MFTRKIRTGVALSLVLAFIVMISIALYADVPHMIVALARFRWEFLPLILGFTLFNYFWRFIKWQYYLKRLNIHIVWSKSLLIFLSGLSMAITPGKVGELLKSYLLKRSMGVAISRTAPIIVAERLTDGIAMLGLAATGLVLYRFGWELLLVLLVVGVAGIVLIQNRSFALALLSVGEQLPVLSRIAHLLRTFYESSYTLLRWRPLLLAVCIGLVSWSGECGALYFVYHGLGVVGSFDLFIKAMFILAVSSLIGSVSGLPGGLGTADGSMVGLTRVLISTSAALGGAATLLIRLCTLWFGLLIGVAALLTFRFIQRNSIEHRDGWGADNHKQDTVSPMDERLSGGEPASASASTWRKSCMKTLIIIPTYNEIENLRPILEAAFSYAPETDILIVDDNSPDGTGQLADQIHEEDPHVHVLHRAGKLGLGTAYIAGFKYAVAHNYDAAFEMDADFSHDPRYLPEFLKAIEDADLVIGSRYVPGGGTPNWSPVRRFISGGGNIFARFMLGIPVHDCTAGYRCYRREVLERIDLDTVQSQGYAFQVELAYRVMKQGFKIVEIPIVFMDRRVGKSKMSRTIIIEAFTYVLRTRFGLTPRPSAALQSRPQVDAQISPDSQLEELPSVAHK